MKEGKNFELVGAVIVIAFFLGAGYYFSKNTGGKMPADTSINTNMHMTTDTTNTKETSGEVTQETKKTEEKTGEVHEKTDIATNPTASSDMRGLKITDLIVGTGAEAVHGKRLSMHYVGTLLNGTKFDSSRDRGTPFEFTLGAGEVIQGWDMGIVGMKVGGKRKLVIPAPLAYGSSSRSPAIPPNSTLVFEVELLGVK